VPASRGVRGRQLSAPSFDPRHYKEKTREQWQTAAEAWHRWGPTLEQWLGEATEEMLVLARVEPGSRVLDVAAGTGGQTLAAARRAGPSGRVVATDISPRILEFAAAEARAAGLTNVDTHAVDGEELAVEPESFDAAICRLGLMYFPNRAGALAGVRDALKPGGRFAGIVFSTPDRSPFFSLPVSIIQRRAELPPPAPGLPGPFSVGGEGVLGNELAGAGFVDVEVRRVEAPVRLASAAECVRFEQESFGALHQMLAGLDDDGRAAAWAEIAETLAQFEGADGFTGPCELLVGAGTRP